MQRHIEGGWFAEVYRSTDIHGHLPPRYGINATRSFSTQIYYLLENDDFSKFHQLKSDEIWHHYRGERLTLFVIDQKTGQLTRQFLGGARGKNVAVMMRGDWFAARMTYPKAGKYSLVGNTVAPGFQYADYHEPTAEELIELFPKHQKIIEELTRS